MIGRSKNEAETEVRRDVDGGIGGRRAVLHCEMRKRMGGFWRFGELKRRKKMRIWHAREKNGKLRKMAAEEAGDSEEGKEEDEGLSI